MPWVSVGKRTINIENVAHLVVEQEDVVQIFMVGDAGRSPIRLEGAEARALKSFIERGELGEIRRVFLAPWERAEIDEARSRKQRAAKGAKNGRSAPEIVL